MSESSSMRRAVVAAVALSGVAAATSIAALVLALRGDASWSPRLDGGGQPAGGGPETASADPADGASRLASPSGPARLGSGEPGTPASLETRIKALEASLAEARQTEAARQSSGRRWMPSNDEIAMAIKEAPAYRQLPDHLRGPTLEWIQLAVSNELAVFDGAVPDATEGLRRSLLTEACEWNARRAKSIFERAIERAQEAKHGQAQSQLDQMIENQEYAERFEDRFGKALRESWGQGRLSHAQQERWNLSVAATLKRARDDIGGFAMEKARERPTGR